MINDIICLCLDKRKDLWTSLEADCAEKIPQAKFHKFIVGDGCHDLVYNHVDPAGNVPSTWMWGDGIQAWRHYCAFLSHKEIIKYAINNNIDNFLLLEDDAHILRRYNNVMSQIQLPKEWDIIYLGWHAFEYENHKFAGTNLRIEEQYKKDGRAYIQELIQCGGLFAALINKTLYRTILRLPEIAPIDSQINLLKFNNSIKAYNVIPMSIYTKSGISNCEGIYIERDVL